MCSSIKVMFCGISVLLMAWLFTGVSVSHAQEEGINAKNLFVYHCATCHGEDGKGTKRGHELKSPNLADADWQAKKRTMRYLIPSPMVKIRCPDGVRS